MIEIINAILAINSNAEVTIENNDIDKITWHNGTPSIPKEQILAIIPQVELDIAMETLRAKRNKLLADTDFHALSDQTLSPEMTAYRQALRDITEGLTTVEEVNAVQFPTKP